MRHIGGLRAALDTGTITSADLLAEAISALVANASLNSFTHVEADAAVYDTGALAGVPIAIKDNIAVAGMPWTGGSRALGSKVASSDAPTVGALRSAGATLIGKTNLHEFALGVTSNNGVFGAVGNPVVPGRSAGGSSGGMAAAIAAGIVPAGLGTDTGGSGRIPASFCGCVGFRPTTGRYSTAGVRQLTWTLDTVSPMGRTVDDVATLDRLLTSRGVVSLSAESPLRLGIPRNSFAADLDNLVAEAFATSLSRLADAGIALIEVDLDEAAAIAAEIAYPVAAFEIGMLWRRELAERGFSINTFIARITSADVAAQFTAALKNGPSPNLYSAVMARELPTLRALYAKCFQSQGLDALVFPTVAVPPPLLGEDSDVLINGEARPLFPTITRNTCPASLAALPAISMPFGSMRDGSPFGLELTGPAGRDEQLLAVAKRLENVAA